MVLNFYRVFYVLVSLGIFGAQASQIPWMDSGFEALANAKMYKSMYQERPLVVTLHHSEWGKELRRGLGVAKTTASAEIRTNLDTLVEKVAVFEEAEALSYNMLQLFYLAISGALSNYEIAPVVMVFDEAKELDQLVKALVSVQNLEGAREYENMFEGLLKEKPPLFFVHSWITDKPALGVKTLVDGLLQEGITLVPISLKHASVHGGLVNNSYSQALHDWIHGMEFAGEILASSSLRSQLPKLREGLLSLSDTDPVSQRMWVQWHLLLHETTVNIIDGTPLDTWDDLRRAAHEFIKDMIMDPPAYQEKYIEKYTTHYLRSPQGRKEFLGKEFMKNASEVGFTLDDLASLVIIEYAPGHFTINPMQKGESSVTFKEIKITTEGPENRPDGYFKINFESASIIKGKSPDGSSNEWTINIRHNHTFPPVPILQQNASDYGWLFKQIGLVPKERSLKNDPLSPQEIHNFFIQVVDTPSPFFSA